MSKLSALPSCGLVHYTSTGMWLMKTTQTLVCTKFCRNLIFGWCLSLCLTAFRILERFIFTLTCKVRVSMSIKSFNWKITKTIKDNGMQHAKMTLACPLLKRKACKEICGREALWPKAPQQEVHRIEDIQLHRPRGNLIKSGLHLDMLLVASFQQAALFKSLSDSSGGSFLWSPVDKESSC